MPVKEHICLGCGVVFYEYKSRPRKYCSRACVPKRYTALPNYCGWCGSVVPHIPKKMDPLYCSSGCKERSRVARLIRYECVGCGKTFIRKSSISRKYCSPKCYPKRKAPVILICLECGVSYTPKNSRRKTGKYCSVKCRDESRRLYPKEERRARYHLSKGTILMPHEIPKELVAVKMLQLELMKNTREIYHGK